MTSERSAASLTAIAASTPWVALTGPTASGKSSMAMRLAQRLPLEIVSVDSALVYRGMDIGTAKPSLGEREAVPHHLVDILEPTQSYSAAAFVRQATAAIDDIAARGRLPLLVGGTMLYLRALLHGLDDLPAADPHVRAELEAEALRVGWPAMHAALATVDAQAAQRLAPNDAQRIQRALEVWRLTGRPLSSWHTAGDRVAPPATHALVISLEPASRPWLHQRIEGRLDAMLAAGLLDEVRTLMARGDLNPDMPSMRCVGYRQAWAALQPHGDLAAVRPTALAATRQLAKRQHTWLRSMATRVVVVCDRNEDAVFDDVWRTVRQWRYLLPGSTG